MSGMDTMNPSTREFLTTPINLTRLMGQLPPAFKVNRVFLSFSPSYFVKRWPVYLLGADLVGLSIPVMIYALSDFEIGEQNNRIKSSFVQTPSRKKKCNT